MIRGVVLCGGESKRMGSDKGLLVLDDANWASLAFHKMKRLSIPVYVSINPFQLPAYSQFFDANQLVTDSTKAKGPLQGLLSIHLKYPDDDILVLACDMIKMDSYTLKKLKNSRQTFPGFEYYLCTQEDFMEPLCAVYTASALKGLYRELENDTLPGFSLHKIIKTGSFKALSISNHEIFNNYNTITK